MDEISYDARQLMISSLSIENFRCFKKVELGDLGRFNLVVGDSGSGKTALFEAIFLPGNGAGVPVTYRGNRGMIIPSFSPEKDAYDALFSDLFFELSTDIPIKIKIVGSYQNLRKAEISFQPITQRPLIPEDELKGDRIADRLFTVHTTDADNMQSVQQVNLKGLLNIGGEHKVASIAFYASSSSGDARIFAQMLSDIRKSGADNQIERTMHSLFPQISDLSPELTGGAAEIYCNVVGVKRKVPLSLVSNGMSKVLVILLFIATHPDGVVLVDEIENGIYYKALPKMWGAIIEFCKSFNVQFFASTHSKECIEALVPFIEQDDQDFRLIRTEHKNSSHTARIFKGKNFSAALETGTEIR